MVQHNGKCATGEGHETLMLVVRVEQEQADFARRLLEVVRSGLVSGYAGDELEYACTYYGPLTIDGADQEIVEAICEKRDGSIDATPDEPILIRRNAMLEGVRALVGQAIGVA